MNEAYTMVLTPVFRFTESLELETAHKAILPDGVEVMFRYHAEGSSGAAWRGKPGWEMDKHFLSDGDVWYDSIKEAKDSAIADLKLKHAKLIDRVATAYSDYVVTKAGQ